MKLSDLRPCDCCHGPLSIAFFVLDAAFAVVDVQAVRQVAGLDMYFGGRFLALAEAMAPQADVATLTDSRRILLCMNCYTSETLASVLDDTKRPPA